MSGTSNITGLESITFTDNMSFDGTERGGAMTLDGQLWIGSTAGRHVRLGTLTAGTGVSITNGSGSITIGLTGGGIAVEHLTANSGGALNPDGSNNFNIVGLSGSKTSGSGSTITIKSPPYADASGSATSTLNSGSFVTGAFTLTLPVSAGLADGDLFEYVATSASALVVQAVGAQKIRIGSALSSAAGTATSNAIGDSLTLRFRASDGFFYATSVIGVWTIA